MKQHHLTLPESATNYLRQKGKTNISAAFREYIEWDVIWGKFWNANEHDAQEMAANMVRYLLDVRYPTTYPFRDHEEAQCLRTVGHAIIAVSEHFARHSGATFQDPEIKSSLDKVIAYGRRLKPDGNPLELFKSAVGTLAYALSVV